MLSAHTPFLPIFPSGHHPRSSFRTFQAKHLGPGELAEPSITLCTVCFPGSSLSQDGEDDGEPRATARKLDMAF